MSPKHRITASGRRTSPRFAAGISVLVLAVAWLAAPASAGPLQNSTFESDDGNLTPAGGLDWNSATVVTNAKIVKDKPSGASDDSFNAKEDDPVPTLSTGSIPPNKSDLKEFGLYTEVTTSNQQFLHLFWTRVQDPSGTTNMDFEFNQKVCDLRATPPKTQCSSNNVTPPRTVGDLLVTYDLSRGGTVPTISRRSWNGTMWDPPESVNETNANGAINTAIVTRTKQSSEQADTTYGPRTFGEAAISLGAIFKTQSCMTFGGAYLKSRSSDSFTSALKDFIAPISLSLSNCGSLAINKTGAGGGNLGGAKFKVYKDDNSPGSFDAGVDDLATASDGSTECETAASDGTGNCVYTNLPIGGKYWIVETAAPTGYQAADPTVALDSAIIAETRRITATVNNQAALGDLEITKQDDAGNLLDGVTFTITGTSTANSPVSRSCTTGASVTGKCTMTNVPVGTYTLAESNVPAGHTGAASRSVTVADGTTAQYTITNPRTHKVIVVVCHEGTNTLASGSVKLGDGTPVATTSTVPSIGSASSQAVEAALCGLAGLPAQPHGDITPTVTVGSN